ncbi:MAG: hypothetical protein K6E54_09760 [Bacteroidaceae bacterium]|nr:hypothetical protein [Bacteroidaceae bacterium]
MSRQSRIPGVDVELFHLFERYLKLEAVDKLTVATTFLIVALVIFALGTSAIFFLCSGLVHSLSDLVGSEALANYIVGGVLLLIIVLFYVFRVRLVENRVVAAISASILRAEKNTTSGLQDVDESKVKGEEDNEV